MKRIVFVAVSLCSSCAALAQPTEPITFRGGYLGQPLSDYVDCSAKPKVLKEGYKIHGKVCEGKLGIVYREKSSFWSPLKSDGELFTFQDKKLVRITIHIPNEDWQKVKYDLTEKLGQSASEVPEVYQNGFGARWEYEQ